MTTALLGKGQSVQRLDAAINLVSSLLDSEWAYTDSQDALRRIYDALIDARTDVAELDDDADAELVRQYGVQALQSVSELTSFVGFILRSADTRNSFEIYSPIKEMGAALLGSQIKLIVGSEWNYNPFIYPIPSSVLSEFILVGLPASEAQNSLLLPVAGHELGHAVWRRTTISRLLSPVISRKIEEEFVSRWDDVREHFPPELSANDISTDLVSKGITSKSKQFALRQCEEVFCDLIGFWIFGDAFLSAFAYLLSPDTSRRSSDYYPSNKVRAQHLAKAGVLWGSEKASQLPEVFSEPETCKDIFVVIAQDVTKKMVHSLAEEVEKICSNTTLVRPTNEGTASAEKQLRNLSPTHGQQTPAEILNAAWRVRAELHDWVVPGVATDRKLSILNDLVLKSFEVREWNIRGAISSHA
jgi:hypothetical protein